MAVQLLNYIKHYTQELFPVYSKRSKRLKILKREINLRSKTVDLGTDKPQTS